MPGIFKSTVCLRLTGEYLVPDEITHMLGFSPTKAEAKGQLIKSDSNSKERIAKSGIWLLEATDASPENIDYQIFEIVKKLTEKSTVWTELSDRYDVDLFCGLFMQSSNEGVSISPNILALLSERKIRLNFDIYSNQ